MQSRPESDPWVDELQLLGIPTLTHYVERVRRRALDGEAFDAAGLIDAWRAAVQRFEALETDEAGLADDVPVDDLKPGVKPLSERLLANVPFQKTFDTLPIALGMVELDRLVVCQHRIVAAHAQELGAALGGDLDDESLFKLCLPLEARPLPLIEASEAGHGCFVFRSELPDFRAHGPVLLGPEALQTLPNSGVLAGGVGLMVGFGSSWLNIVRFRGRMVLNNGYHRAYALRSLGVTHVPCVIQAVAHADELPFAGDASLSDDYATLFEAPRPPLFKDFFDPQLTLTLRLRRVMRQIQVRVSVETIRVPE